MIKDSFLSKLITRLKPRKKEPLESPQPVPIQPVPEENKDEIKYLRPLEPDPKIKPVQPKPTPIKK